MQFKFGFAGVALAALVSTAACQNCPGDDGLTINSARGDEYRIACNTSFGGRIDALNIQPNTFGACIDFCSEYTASPGNMECVGVEYWEEGPNMGLCNGISGTCSCYIHYMVSDIQSSTMFDSAFLRKLASSSSSSMTTTTTTISPPSTTLTTTSTPTATPTSSCSTPCNPNTLCCNDSEHFSYCVSEADGSTMNVYFGDVAPGTYCDAAENRIRADNEEIAAQMDRCSAEAMERPS